MKNITLKKFNGISFIIQIIIWTYIGLLIPSNWYTDHIFIVAWGGAVVYMLLINLILHIIVIDFGNTIRSIVYCINGFSFFPIVLFPFCISRVEGKIRIVFTLRISVAFYDFLPKRMDNSIKDERDLHEKLYVITQGIFSKQISRYVLLIFVGILCAFIHRTWLPVIFFLVVDFFFFTIINDRLYHGECVKLKNIYNEKGLLYVLELEDFESDFWTNERSLFILELYEMEENKNYIMAGIKMMLVNSMCGIITTVPDFATIIMDKVINKGDNIDINIDFKELSMTVMYMYYNIFKNDIVRINQIESALRELQNEWGISDLWYRFFQWYLDQLKIFEGKICDPSVKKPIDIINAKNDSIACVPGKYRTRLQMIYKQINSQKKDEEKI